MEFVKNTNSISLVIGIETAIKKLSDVGIDTNNYDFACLAEMNLLTGDSDLINVVKDAFKALGICKGGVNLTKESFNGLVNFINMENHEWIAVDVLSTDKESLLDIKNILASGNVEDLDTLLICSRVLQLIGRYNQETGIDSYKTFKLPVEVFENKLLASTRSAMKELRKAEISWDKKIVDIVTVEKEKDPYYMESPMSLTRNKMMEQLQVGAQSLVNKVQRLDKVRAYLQSGKITIPDGALWAVKFIQKDFMTLSYVNAKTKSEYKKLMDSDLDKVAREAARVKFDPYFFGMRNLLRKMMEQFGVKDGDAALVALQQAIINIDSKNKKEDAKASEVIDHTVESEMISTVVEKLLKEEYSLLLTGDKHIAKTKLMVCDIESGTKVTFTNNYAIDGSNVAYATNIPDGTYEIREIEGNMYAVKVVKEFMQEQIEEQKKSSDICIRLKNFNKEIKFENEKGLNAIIKAGMKYGIELKDTKIKGAYDAVYINGKLVATFDCPVHTDMKLADKVALKKVFLGKWNIKCGDTFVCSNGEEKTFLVLFK